MKTLRRMFEKTKNFCIKYPAVISGIFIYSYLLFCIIHYFIKVKYFSGGTPFVLENVVDSFDAFPFMWLLSVVLVKIIDIRTKLHKSEEQRIIAQQEIDIHQTQLKTLHEVTRGIQHHVNNPLSIIMLTLGTAHKTAAGNPKLTRHLNTLDEQVNRIIGVMSDFSKATSYTVDSVDSHVGDIPARGINI